MRKGQCPKCGSADVRSGAQVSSKGGAGGERDTDNVLECRSMDNYVCVACGYVESYVGDATKLQKIVENWPRVQPG
jgi:predicted nucleic-acid-binding Zn-ribbon protein